MQTRRLAPGDPAASELLRSGALVAFPTETVYGLGADATSNTAVAKVFEAKGRPHFNPLICHYPDAEAAFAHVEAPEMARALAAAFWPGPLTMVLPRRITCPVALLAGAGLDTLAVRVPSHPIALALLREVGRPIAAPSANRSGSVSPHHGGPCGGRAGRADRRDRGWRALRGGGGIDGAGSIGGAPVPAAARRRAGQRDRGADRPGRARHHAGGGGTVPQPALAGSAGVPLRAGAAGTAGCGGGGRG